MRVFWISLFILLALAPLSVEPQSVRRRAVFPTTGSFSPPDIAGLTWWVKADALSLSDGDPVGSWTDSSSNSRSTTQATSAAKPTYKTNILNGKPVVRLDGVDDGMVVDFALASRYTIFIVYNQRGTNDLRRALQGNPNNWLIGPYNGTHKCFTNSGFTAGQSVTQNVFVLACLRQSSTDLQFYINASLLDTLSETSSSPGSKMQIGSGTGSPPYAEPLDGDIAEIVAYDSALSTTDRQSVETYLNTKYAIY